MTNIIFLGTSEFAVPILKKIVKSGIKVSMVFSQPPRKSKRGQNINKSPIHKTSDELNLKISTPNKIIEEFELIQSLNVDIAIVVAYGQIITEGLLNLSKFGFINVHSSLLPKYRGAAPIQRCLINSEKYTGISIMKINNKLDSGPVCNKYKIEIKKNENFLSLSKRLSELGAEKIIENITNILQSKLEFIDQDHKSATYAKKILKSEGKINWNYEASKIQAIINGLYPSPGAWFEFNNERYKILKSKVSYIQGEPGMVIDNQLLVGCGKNSLQIIELQRQGKKPQMTNQFLLGSKIGKNSILK